MKWQVGLKHWRESRGLTSLQPNYVEMMQEELDEQEAAIKANDWHEQIDAICDQLVITTNAIEQTKPLVVDYKPSLFIKSMSKYQLLAIYTGTQCCDDMDEDMDVLLAMYDLLITELTDLGVIPDLAMKEVVKHISARQQDPEQAARWKANPSLIGTEKWLKDKFQSEDTLYKPNYKVCRSKPRS